MCDTILRIDDLGLDSDEHPGARAILGGISLTQAKGEWLALAGPNGAGKTSLGLIIKGLIHPTRGSIRMFSDDSDEDLALRRNRVGFLFSNPRDQVCALTVRSDIEFGPLHHGLSRREARTRADHALDALGIAHLANHTTHSLSGGELQKVALAGLLALNPDYLVLDEPSAFLGHRERDELLALTRGLHASGMSILLISTGWEEIMMADRVAVLHNGGVCWCSSPSDLLCNETVTARAGLCRPEMLALAERLEGRGFVLPAGIHEVNGMARALVALTGKGRD
ncbi:MAG: energy-coupling factor ABC transporter ATP-binding protein [bacterium]